MSSRICVSQSTDISASRVAAGTGPGADGFAEGEGVGGDDDVVGSQVVGIDLDHEVVVEVLGIDDRHAAVAGCGGEDLEA